MEYQHHTRDFKNGTSGDVEKMRKVFIRAATLAFGHIVRYAEHSRAQLFAKTEFFL
jgi:hypothetical protein